MGKTIYRKDVVEMSKSFLDVFSKEGIREAAALHRIAGDTYELKNGVIRIRYHNTQTQNFFRVAFELPTRQKNPLELRITPKKRTAAMTVRCSDLIQGYDLRTVQTGRNSRRTLKRDLDGNYKQSLTPIKTLPFTHVIGALEYLACVNLTRDQLMDRLRFFYSKK